MCRGPVTSSVLADKGKFLLTTGCIPGVPALHTQVCRGCRGGHRSGHTRQYLQVWLSVGLSVSFILHSWKCVVDPNAVQKSLDDFALFLEADGGVQFAIVCESCCNRSASL